MKPFINNAVIGNSRILAALDHNSHFQRIYWPNIDNSQHIEKFLLGIYFPKMSNTIHWLDDNDWTISQDYINNTNILKTILNSDNLGMEIIYNDFVLINKDIIIRNIEIINQSGITQSINFCAYCESVSTSANKYSSFFDYESDSIVYVKSNGYMFLSSNIECKQFQLTNNPFEACNRMFLYGVDDYSLGAEGAMLWALGEVEPSQSLNINLYITFGTDLSQTRKTCNDIKNIDYSNLLAEVTAYWDRFLLGTKKLIINDPLVSSLFMRSTLVLKLLSDESGAIIASPEIDEEYKVSGGYGYCWPRDAVFITTSLDRVGLTSISSKFYEWAAKTQDDKGFWHQRYFANGNIAPSWGLQLDETASVLWGLYYHYKVINDLEFLNEKKDLIIRAAAYLVDSIHEENGLPRPTYDLWEMIVGQHTYTSAAVYSGLKSACQMGRVIGISCDVIQEWEAVSDKIKNSIDNYLWDEHSNTFRKSINAKLNPWGAESGPTKDIVINKKGYWRNFSCEDNRIDCSVIGLVIPFEVYNSDDIKMKNMINGIEDKLFCKEVGGIFRFENDSYMNGNPWILCTIWLGLYYVKNRDFDKAKEILCWVCNHATELGLFSEQIDKYTGKPSWVIPLAWSHSMFIHLVVDLLENSIPL